MLFCGIDLHKRTIAVHTVDAVGALVSNAALLTRREAETAYVATLDGPHQAVCECTSMWYGLRNLLVSQGIDQRLAHAKYLKAITEAKVKTDAVCAATMGDAIAISRWRSITPRFVRFNTCVILRPPRRGKFILPASI